MPRSNTHTEDSNEVDWPKPSSSFPNARPPYLEHLAVGKP
jgi:hypothetical protein